MADTTTTTYSLTKPEVGASADTWGTKINSNLDEIDNILDGTTACAGINITSGTVASSTLSGNLTTVGSSLTGVVATSVDLGNWTITESGGVAYFATSGTNKMKLDASGNLTVVGNVTAYGSV